MRFKNAKYTTYLCLTMCFISIACMAQPINKPTLVEGKIKSGAEVLVGNFGQYAALFKAKKVGIVTNQTGVVGDKHILDALLEQKIQIVKIFTPEHGFRGEADAGETILNGRDKKTSIPIVSLYGKNKKPQTNQIADLDIILFDIQDVGVRFYTYISTLTYIMEAAAENKKKVIVLDRPNPNGHYIDGPILKKEFTSYVGMHPVPIVYGMTIGEYAKMINGEKWLANKVVCDLTIIKLENYNHNKPVSLSIKPSPNLPNDVAINLYPSTCFFEGTNVSEGRGTNQQFQVYGSPNLVNMDFHFVPQPNVGAKNPKYKGQMCHGEDLSNTPRMSEISLVWLLNAYHYNSKQPFFTKEQDGSYWIDKLYGNSDLRDFVEKGYTEKQIKDTWKMDLEKFKKTRTKYLLYP
jgi:uncharacterized protein YbbC (DUF1343 family)